MAEPTPFALAALLSDLLGRQINISQVVQQEQSKTKQMYGVYKVFPGEGTRVLKADLPLLGSFAGCLMGLPQESVSDKLSSASLEEGMRDAIHEVLNIMSTVVSIEHRAVFQAMYSDPVYMPDAAAETLRSPVYRSFFKVSLDSYTGGALSILAPL